MIRFTLPLITFLITCVFVDAQITVTNETFPAEGDTLKTAIDLSPDSIAITPPGGPMTWDFSALTPSSQLVTVFQPASNGAAAADYPGAELVVISDVGTETYYDVSPTSFNNLGLSGEGLAAGLPIEVNFFFQPPLPEKRAPLMFFDIYQSSSGFLMPIAIADIPSEIIDSLGLPTGLVDSIRIRINITRLEVVDGYGTLVIPGGTYDVLREKRTEYSEARLDAHSPFLGWLDVTAQFPIGDFFGVDTVVTYHFISDTEKEPIAIVTMDPTQSFAQQVEFKDNGVVSAIQDITSNSVSVRISPNPATDEVMVELTDLTLVQHTLILFDVFGKRIMAAPLNQENETISLESLSPGTYFYQVVDGVNQVRATGKLVKVD